MATNQVMSHCRRCNKQTVHLQPATSHVLHLLMAVITLGIWIPVWLLVGASNGSQLNCTECGRGRGLFGT